MTLKSNGNLGKKDIIAEGNGYFVQLILVNMVKLNDYAQFSHIKKQVQIIAITHHEGGSYVNAASGKTLDF